MATGYRRQAYRRCRVRTGLRIFVVAFVVGGIAGCDANPAPSATTFAASPTPIGTDVASVCAAAQVTPSPAGDETVDIGTYRYQPEGGPDGGEVAVGQVDPSLEFNPLHAVLPGEGFVSSAIWSGLIVWTSDYKYQPDLSLVLPTTSNGLVSVASDGKTRVTWCLRDGLAWSDGVPITCEDFAYTLDWLRDVEPDRASQFGDVASIDCPAAGFVVVRYPHPFAGYLGRALPPLPRHALERRSLAELRAGSAFAASALPDLPTSGAFSVSTIDPGGDIHLTRNTFFRAGTRGQPAHLDALTIRTFASLAAEQSAYEAGEISVAVGFAEADITALEDRIPVDSISSSPSSIYDTVRFNFASGRDPAVSHGCSTNPRVQARGEGCPAADRVIRTAISHLIDRYAIAAAVDGPQSYLGGVVNADAWFFHEVDFPGPSVGLATDLLQEDGWVDTDGDGIRQRDGLSAVLELCTLNQSRYRQASSMIREALAAGGIKVIVQAVSRAVLQLPYASATRTSPCALSRGNFDLALAPVVTSYETVDFRWSYHSSAVEPRGGNDARIAIKEIDDALDEATGSVDFRDIRRGMQAFQLAIADWAVEIPLGAWRDVELVRNGSTGPAGIGNFYANPGGAVTWNAVDWYLLPSALSTSQP
jgi:peptide/nickel transport system substrate-binding protein